MSFLGFGIIKVEQGKALIVSRVGSDRVDVSFTGRMVWPVVHKAELMDISVKTIEIDRRGADGLICRDNIRADIKVTFFVRVNKTKDDVIKVAQSIGCARASDPRTLHELFNAKFSEALKTVGKQLDFVDLYTKRDEFRDQIIRVLGTDLNGYSLEDAAIDYLEQTPLEQLDEHNILDAQGIRKITELTAAEHIRTNDYRRNEEKSIKKQDVEAAEAIFELERQEADAKAKQEREISTVRAREEAEILRVQSEEKLRSETARLKTEEQVSIQQENLQREVDVAAKNRERVVAVETERVEKERQLEVISRERETELRRIAKDKEVEHEKRDIAEVIRERIAVEKTVAEQEEEIKRVRVVEEANRQREAVVISAEAEAQESLVKDIKAAEAAEKAATHRAKEQLTLAEAELEASDRRARAQIRMAEGQQAEAAATGLAEVQVKERDAEAVEKLGLAEARVKEADASAEEKQGLAAATVMREQGLAEGEAIRVRLQGEAAGLTEKAEAMKALDGASREHEEYRLRLEAQKDVYLQSIEAGRLVAEAQARILGQGLEQANIDIVGGESVFLDRLVSAVSAGKAVDGFLGNSDAAKGLMDGYLDGRRNLGDDLKGLGGGSFDTEDLKNLTLSALLMKLIAGSKDGEEGSSDSADGDEGAASGRTGKRSKVEQVLSFLDQLGLGDLKLTDLGKG